MSWILTECLPPLTLEGLSKVVYRLIFQFRGGMKDSGVDSFRRRVNRRLGRVISSQVHRVARAGGRWLAMFGELGHKGLEMLLGTFDLLEAVVIGAAGQA